MDCITPSHPHKIPHGETLDISQILDQGQQALLDPSIIPTSPPHPEKYTYTPRESVMSTFEPSDVAFIKAQITKDDKEVRDIIKEKTRSVSTIKPSTSRSSTKSSGKNNGWASAQPQSAVLMDMESGLYPDFRTPPRTPAHGARQAQVGFDRSTWKPRPYARA